MTVVALELLVADLITKATIISLCAWIATKLCRKRPASVRHLIWAASFVVLICLPAQALFTPVYQVPVLSNPVPEVLNRVTAPVAIDVAYESKPELPLTPSANQLCLTIWITGLAFVLLRLFSSGVSLWRLRRASRIIATSELAVDARLIARNLKLRRLWDLRSTDDPTAPIMTWWGQRPVVLLPSSCSGWTSNRQEAVLLHELAHVKRGDALFQLLSAVACSLYWFHPLVWLSARAMRNEAEAAADDAVLISGMKPSAYASELVSLAATFGDLRRPLNAIGVSIMKKSKLQCRVEAIVNPHVRRRGVSSVEALVSVTVALAILTPLVLLRASTYDPAAPLPAAAAVGGVAVQRAGTPTKASKRPRKAHSRKTRTRRYNRHLTELAIRDEVRSNIDRAHLKAVEAELARRQASDVQRISETVRRLSKDEARSSIEAEIAAKNIAKSKSRADESQRAQELARALAARAKEQESKRADFDARQSELNRARERVEALVSKSADRGAQLSDLRAKEAVMKELESVARANQANQKEKEAALLAAEAGAVRAQASLAQKEKELARTERLLQMLNENQARISMSRVEVEKRNAELKAAARHRRKSGKKG